MDKPKMLSGDHLVSKGVTKIEATLPEIGLKDVLPNGSWLEQKQIQAALEARKHLVEVERIEKCGALSHAEWRDDLMLAEVTRKAGSYWQYMGHNVGKHLYLQPEEALFLMEVNSLQLRHNEITVSLQKAYSLLLGNKISLDQYKVYASLSRLGYKVFRHKNVEPNKENNTSITVISQANEDNECIGSDVNTVEISKNKMSEKSDIKIEDSPRGSIQNGKSENDLSKDSDVTSSVNIEEANKCNKELKSINSVNANESTLVESRNMSACVIEIDDNMNEKQNFEGKSDETNKDKGIYSMEYVDSESTRNENSELSPTMEVEMVNVKMAVEAIKGTFCKNKIVRDGKVLANVEFARMNKRKRKNEDDINECAPYYYQTKLQKLQNRKFKPCDANNADKYFDNIPNIVCNNHTVTVKVPKEQYIPKNIFVNNTSYVLNLENMQRRRPASNESTTYSVSDEVNDAHIRRLRSSSNELPQNTPFMNTRFFRHQQQFRPYSFLRPRLNFGYYQFNLFLQRPYLPQTYFPQRAHFQMFQPQANIPRLFQNPNIASTLTNESNNASNRCQDDTKVFHLQAVKNLAMRLKALRQSGNIQSQNFSSLHRLLDIYNARYCERLILTENDEIINNNTVIETIELDDGEESKSKQQQCDNIDEFDKHLNKFKALAAKLKELEMQDRSSARHRRAFSNALKTFNKSYNADIYLNVNYEIVDRKYITLDSSSDSDCVIEQRNEFKKGKKLRNPFNILKRLSEKLNPQLDNPSTSKGLTENDAAVSTSIENNKYSERLQNTFDKKWLPDFEDFGRAELVPKRLMNIRLLDINKEKFIFDFIKTQKRDLRNWMDIKKSFLRHIQETEEALHRERTMSYENNSMNSVAGLKPIIGPDDCTDMPSILNKLRIIRTNNVNVAETSLSIDFDVYNRDVQNFRKRNRPKVHFRVICKNESTCFPSAEDLTALQSRYDDNVALVFAVVGIGSISYLQINPADLPVYIPSNDLS